MFLQSACGSSIPSFLNVINTNENPPTFNRTNKFTNGFQALIDAYGVASYREANPGNYCFFCICYFTVFLFSALYTIITFPFLFAVMFGDSGHGMLMALFGLYLVISEKSLEKKKIDNEIFNIFFAGRYIILLMGFFSMYTGFIYNDIFSKSINIFGTTWSVNYTKDTVIKNEFLTLNPTTDFTQYPYFIGIDPAWQVSVTF